MIAHRRFWPCLPLLLGFLAPAAASSLAADGALRAAVVKVDITPDSSQWLLGYAARKSTGVHDRIYHRIVAMDDGREQFTPVSPTGTGNAPVAKLAPE